MRNSEMRKREIMLTLDALLSKMENLLPKHYRLTVIGRNTNMDDADFVMTRDDLKMVMQSLDSLISQKESGVAEVSDNGKTLH